MTISALVFTDSAGLPIQSPFPFVLGELVPYDAWTWSATVSGGHYVTSSSATGLPAGVTLDDYGPELAGAPTEAGDGEATVTVTDNGGHSFARSFYWTVGGPPLPAPATVTAEPAPNALVVSWEPVPGAAVYRIRYRPTGETGDYLERTADLSPATLPDLPPAVSVDVQVQAEGGEWSAVVAGIPTEAAPDPDPEPEPEPEPEPAEPDPAMPDDLAAVRDSLAPVLAAFIDRADDADTIATAKAHLPVVIEFVRGYTRGRGFTGYVPEYPLRSVIVAAGARLVVNPEQVRQYSTGDYSETSPIFQGYTLAELGTLRRYRRVSA